MTRAGTEERALNASHPRRAMAAINFSFLYLFWQAQCTLTSLNPRRNSLSAGSFLFTLDFNSLATHLTFITANSPASSSLLKIKYISDLLDIEAISEMYSILREHRFNRPSWNDNSTNNWNRILSIIIHYCSRTKGTMDKFPPPPTYSTPLTYPFLLLII